MRWRRQRGFTLIEVLVSLAIFGILSLLAYAALGSSLSNAELLTARMDRLQAVQRSMGMLTADLMQAAPRPVRDELGETRLPAITTSLAAEFALELTRGGWGNPAGLPRGTLQRVAYRLEDDQLVRYHWNVLDRTYANQPVAVILLDQVESLLFRYYLDNGEWTDVWPPAEQRASGTVRSRPRAVEIELTLADEGQITRLVEVAP